MSDLIPDLTLAALDKLDGAAAAAPFRFGLKNKLITFPDPMELDALETEKFLQDMQSISAPMAALHRWLSETDYQAIVDAHLTGRQVMLLLREANKHYERALGEPGKD